ncbi:hypothetical protein GQ54DRAFT_104094 [Martensiomyces pterosporus]|nr:hypothetical protein GQ54DRAFT_104094 [Martensiomyces pterosporus]
MNLKRTVAQAVVIGAAATAVTAKIDWISPCTISAISATWNEIRFEMAILLPFSWVILGFDKFNKIKKLLGGHLYLPAKPDLATELGLLQIVGPDQMELFIGPILKAYWLFHPCPTSTPTPVPPAPTSTAGPKPTSIPAPTPPPAATSNEPCPPGYTLSTPGYSAAAPTSSPINIYKTLH